MSDYFERHTLQVLGSDPLTVLLQHPEWVRMESTLLIFAEKQIVIAGGLCPGRNGVISDYGYDHRWFSSWLSESYLCEKFLTKTYQPGEAIECLRVWLEDAEDYGIKAEDIELVRGVVREGECAYEVSTPDRFYDFMNDIDQDFITDCLPGWNYPSRDVKLLVEIQGAFRRLWWKMVEELKVTSKG